MGGWGLARVIFFFHADIAGVRAFSSLDPILMEVQLLLVVVEIVFSRSQVSSPVKIGRLTGLDAVLSIEEVFICLIIFALGIGEDGVEALNPLLEG